MTSRIPLRELKNQCSAIVRRAEAGEEFEVTVDGRLCARLVPARPPGPRRFVPVDELLAAMPDLPADRSLPAVIGDDVDPILDDPFGRFPAWRGR